MERQGWSSGQLLTTSSQKRSYPTSTTQASNLSTKKRRLMTGYEACGVSNPPEINRLQGVEILSDQTQRPRFKARPVPRSHYTPSLCIQSSQRPLTVPKDPLVLSHSQSPSTFLPSPSVESLFRAQPMPDFSHPMQPVSTHTPTSPQPFRLLTEERGLEKTISRHHRLHMESLQQAQLQRFTAKPLPAFPPPPPIVHPFTPTTPQPFSIQPPKSTKLPAFPVNNAFKARPMPNFHIPFQPVLPGKHTEPMDIELNSDIQASHRAKFDAICREKQQKALEEAAISAHFQALKDAEEVKLMRKTLEFHALPLPAGLYKTPKFPAKDENSSQNIGNLGEFSTEDSMDICD